MTDLSHVRENSPGEAFERFFRAYHPAVFAFARRRADLMAAHDVTAETFTIAWRRWDELPHERPLPWLYGVARRVLANTRRSERRQRALIDQLASGPEDSPRQDDFVIAALNRLGTTDRDVLLLVAWEGLSPREAAEVLGISYAAFRVRAHRARGRLVEELGGRGLTASVTEREIGDGPIESKERRYG